jgi:prepilin-type N-terminal cleavage/methylation domain-containing protein/prepilin-type processing-associated H-X9-DG protein
LTDSRRIRLRRAFTLIELMVVVAVIALLMGILLPSLSAAREVARSIKCSSNIRQLGQANELYARDNKGQYVLAHARFLTNLERWHGTRAAIDQPFDPADGPLTPYLGTDGAIKSCPTYEGKFVDGVNAFEAGCGGYGYNSNYIGSDILDGNRTGVDASVYNSSANAAEIIMPDRKLMFADAGFMTLAAPGQPGVIEYSFLEPPLGVLQPSMHFRHRGRQSNVFWADGHVAGVDFGHTLSVPGYEDLSLGWPGADSAEALRMFKRDSQ